MAIIDPLKQQIQETTAGFSLGNVFNRLRTNVQSGFSTSPTPTTTTPQQPTTLTQVSATQPPRTAGTTLSTPQAPPAQPAPLATVTEPVQGVTTSAPNEQFEKSLAEGGGFFDVFEKGTGRKIEQDEFQLKGLNIDLIGERQVATPTVQTPIPAAAQPTPATVPPAPVVTGQEGAVAVEGEAPVRPPASLTDTGGALRDLTSQLAEIQRQRQEFQKQITEKITPSEREVELQKEIADIGTATRRGIFAQEDRPIQLGAIAGRQQKVLRAGALASETAANELEALQTSRIGALSSLQQQLGFTANDIEILKATTGVQEKIDIAERQRQIGELIQQTPGDTLFDKYASLLNDGTILLKDIPESIQDDIFGGADDLDEILSVKDARELGVPFGTTKRQAFGITPEKVDELSLNQKITLTSKLANDFERNAKLAREAIRQVSIIETAFNKAQRDITEGKSINAASQGVLVAFQKLLDPTSVVRESEFARSSQGLSLLSRIDGLATKLRQGGAGVAARDLQEFRDLGVEFMENDSQMLINFARRTALQAEQAGLDLEAILTPDVLSLLESFDGGGDGGGEITDEEFNVLREEFQDLTDEELRSLGFNQVGSDTQTAVDIPSIARLAFVNNNPGNLKFVGQAGATEGENGFAKFNSSQAGFDALKAQVELDSSRDLTLRQFVFKFAPPSENDSEQYLQQMVERLGVSDSTKLKDIDLNDLARKVAFKESGTVIRA